MNKLDQANANLKNYTPILMYTTDIQNVADSRWTEIRSFYETTESELAKILVSILNSIATQNRIYFCITREKVRFLVKNDVNWSDEKPEFGNESWKTIIRLLHDTSIGMLEQKGTGRKPSIYRLGDAWHSLVDLRSNDDQKVQAIEFVNRSKFQDDKRT